ATEQLDRVRKLADRHGAKLLFTGDHEQLDAVGGGGGLRLVAETTPPFELDVGEGRRFQHAWERDASVGLREGRLDSLREYDERGRLEEGSVEDMTRRATLSYVADALDGN